MDLVIAGGAYALFLVVTSIITKIFNPQALSGSLIDVIKTMSTDMYQASKPILQDSIILMFVGWGIFIPMAETWLFNGKIFEAIHDGINKKGVLTIVLICMIVGALAALYHLSSKSGNSTALMITFTFFTLSGLLVWWRKDLRAAIFLHMIANSIAVGFPLIGG
jgi:membrane protease YdiL (CAAX protease family)